MHELHSLPSAFRRRRTLVPAGLLLALLASLLVPAAAGAQIPEEFTNLQVLDKEIGRGELIATMRGFATQLGVRCNHCHVGPDNLQGMDFATDEKRHKRVAREMMKMVRSINGDHLQTLPARDEGDEAAMQTVTCYTCHRGQTRPPRSLYVALGETVREQGVEAALDEYDRLRAEHYGDGTYDFSSRTLARVGQGLLEAGMAAEAAGVLERNVRDNPDSADAIAALGMARLANGEAAVATELFEKALKIDPENRLALFGQRQAQAATPETP